MRCPGLLGMVMVPVLMLAGMLATSAYALPEFLPSSQSFTSKATGASILESSTGTKVECGAASGSGGIQTDTSGTFKTNFEKCKASLGSCTGGGDPTETILSEGTFHFVFEELGTGETLGVAILLQPKEMEFSCTALVKNKVKGTLLCSIVTPLTSSITHQFECAEGEKAGEAECHSYWNDNGTSVSTQLLDSLNGGEFKESNEQVSTTISTSEASAWMNE